MLINTVMLCAAVALGAGEAKSQATGEPSQELALMAIEQNVVNYTNAERARHGLPALEVDVSLMESARRHASWMAENGSLVHTRQSVAENIAMGYPHSSEAVRGWMGSSGHRANILSRGYRRIGVAAYRTASGTIYWCQQFLN